MQWLMHNRACHTAREGVVLQSIWSLRGRVGSVLPWHSASSQLHVGGDAGPISDNWGALRGAQTMRERRQEPTI
jgi:hypothetical protein